MALRLSEVLCRSQRLRARCTFPATRNEPSSGRTPLLLPRTSSRPPCSSRKSVNAPQGGRPNELDFFPARRPGHRPTRYSDRRATLPAIRQHSPNAAGPKNMMDSAPKAHCTLRTSRPKALPGSEATSPTALPRQTPDSTSSWLLWMFIGGDVVGQLF
jgi:hypothetical protein